MFVKWMKQDGASGAKHGRDMKILYETNWDPAPKNSSWTQPNGQSACLAKVYTGLRLNVPNLNIS